MHKIHHFSGGVLRFFFLRSHINCLHTVVIQIIDAQHTLLLSALSSPSPPPSCRSLNMDCENQEKDKDGNPTTTGAFNNSNTNNSECFMSE